MFVSTKYKCVYVCPRKTGTRSVRIWLRDFYSGEKCGSYHSYKVPEVYRSFFIFMTVRNPYEQLYSYWHDKARHPGKGREVGSSLKDVGRSFTSVCASYFSKHRNLSTFYRESGSVHYVKLESLSQGLSTLSFYDRAKPLPGHERKTPKKPSSFFCEFGINSAEAECVRHLFCADFETFGYDPQKVTQ